MTKSSSEILTDMRAALAHHEAEAAKLRPAIAALEGKAHYPPAPPVIWQGQHGSSDKNGGSLLIYGGHPGGSGRSGFFFTHTSANGSIYPNGMPLTPRPLTLADLDRCEAAMVERRPFNPTQPFGAR